MNKQKYNLISSIISLSVTSLLLVFICLAWYSTNKNASVTGGSASIISTESEGYITDIRYYKVGHIDGEGNYIIEKDAEGNAVEVTSRPVEMGSYDSLMGSTHHVLMKVVLNSTNLKISATTNTSLKDASGKPLFLGATTTIDSKTVAINEIQKTGNSISSVIKFHYIPSTSVSLDSSNHVSQFTLEGSSNATFVKSTGSGNNIVYDNNLKESIVLCEGTGNVDVIYILLDYDTEAIQYIYNVNLGSENLNPSDDDTDEHWDDVGYTCDFKMTVEEVSTSNEGGTE